MLPARQQATRCRHWCKRGLNKHVWVSLEAIPIFADYIRPIYIYCIYADCLYLCLYYVSAIQLVNKVLYVALSPFLQSMRVQRYLNKLK